jgi:hypothetical protein
MDESLARYVYAATAELLAPYVAAGDFNARVAAALLREVQERMAC